MPHSKEASLQESLNQLKEKMARDALQLQEISSDRALKYSELAAVQEELAQVKEEKEVTQQQNNELQVSILAYSQSYGLSLLHAFHIVIALLLLAKYYTYIHTQDFVQ